MSLASVDSLELQKITVKQYVITVKLNFSLFTAGVQQNSMHSWPLHNNNVRSDLHALAACPWEKNHIHSLTRRLGHCTATENVTVTIHVLQPTIKITHTQSHGQQFPSYNLQYIQCIKGLNFKMSKRKMLVTWKKNKSLAFVMDVVSLNSASGLTVVFPLYSIICIFSLLPPWINQQRTR